MKIVNESLNEFFNNRIDDILDKISTKGMDSLTQQEIDILNGLETFKDPGSKFHSIHDFKPGNIYVSADGNNVKINDIDDKFVYFVVNNRIQDMKRHELFLSFMNGDIGFDLMNF